MERSTSVPTGMGEQSLTPGEQRILALMEQGQQRMDQRLERMDRRLLSLEEGQQHMDQRLERTEQHVRSLEGKLEAQTQQIQDLSLRMDQESAASRLRHRQLSIELENLRQEACERDVQLRDALNKQMHKLRTDLCERLLQHNTRLEVLELTVRLNSEHIRENATTLQALQQEEQPPAGKVNVSRVAAVEPRHEP